jgi:TPR repeat protein
MRIENSSHTKGIVMGISLLVATIAFAQEGEGQWQKDLREISSAADSGDPKAMGIMGTWLRNGTVPPIDMDKALLLSKKSADLGDAFGKYSLARIYEVQKSDGAARVGKEAFQGLQKLAQEGQDSFAMFFLAACYDTGTGVEKNPAQAVKWYREAADQGLAAAQNNLGVMYEQGTGVEKDPAQAVSWFRKAAAQGNADAQKHLASSAPAPANEMEAVQAFFQAAQKTADKVVEETASEVNDPEPEKFGGPPTDVVVRIITSGGNPDINNPQSVEAMLMMGLLKGLNANKPLIRDIKRGKPLTSLISAQIPTGTTVFPIRVTIASAMGPSQNMDFYFYQDEFGDWSAVEKPN